MSTELPGDLVWIDAHHHLWNLSRVDYPWLMAKGEARFFGQPDPIRKDYLLADYFADTNGKIERSIHVQVGARPGLELAETRFVDDCSRMSNGRFPAAAVVAVDLGRKRIKKELDAQMAFPLVRGVRHMIGKSPEENSGLAPFIPDVWVDNWRVLVGRGLSFDLQLTEDQFDEVLPALRKVPDLKVALCHFASPWDRSPEGFQRWRQWMRLFSELPNLKIKLSGWSMYSKQWNEQEFLQWSSAAVEIFGAERCMLGSNFPVDSLYLNYDELFSAWNKLVDRCSRAEACQLAGASARDFYGI